MRDRRSDLNPDWLDPRPVRAQVAVPVADILAGPGGPRDRQLLWGEEVEVLGHVEGSAYIRALRDGYLGLLDPAVLQPPVPATHRVTSRATHVYARADIKSPDRLTLGRGSRLSVAEVADGFAWIEAGYVPHQHIQPIEPPATDPIEEALQWLGTPYLWGGNSVWGIDCSGLVQAAFLACGRPCPGDSDQQLNAFGPALPADAPVERGDLFFWQGHVALAAAPGRLLHANAHHMSTVVEELEPALARIAGTGTEFLAHVRPSSAQAV